MMFSWNLPCHDTQDLPPLHLTTPSDKANLMPLHTISPTHGPSPGAATLRFQQQVLRPLAQAIPKAVPSRRSPRRQITGIPIHRQSRGKVQRLQHRSKRPSSNRIHGIRIRLIPVELSGIINSHSNGIHRNDRPSHLRTLDRLRRSSHSSMVVVWMSWRVMYLISSPINNGMTRLRILLPVLNRLYRVRLRSHLQMQDTLRHHRRRPLHRIHISLPRHL